MNPSLNKHNDKEGYVQLTNVRREFPDNTGLHATNLEIREGEFVSILGPSGCGKSTLLRCVAGLETPDEGRIEIAGETVFDGTRNVAPNKRGLSMVFQDLALWPHMTVAKNIEFPLTTGAKLSAAERKTKVDAAMAQVDITAKADARPQDLSGGQQQRVAIARALVSSPQLMLLDEPLSALDAALREQIRAELMELNRSLGLTMIYVTHDQHEALAMSDRVVVMNEGSVRQFASPEELYLHPADEFVGNFVGTMNRHSSGLAVRPENVRLEPADAPAVTSAFAGTVASAQYAGGRFELRVDVDGAKRPWLVYAPAALAPGTPVRLAAS